MAKVAEPLKLTDLYKHASPTEQAEIFAVTA